MYLSQLIISFTVSLICLSYSATVSYYNFDSLTNLNSFEQHEFSAYHNSQGEINIYSSCQEVYIGLIWVMHIVDVCS